MNGQVCGCEWPIRALGRQLEATVLAPERTSLHRRHHSKYANDMCKTAKETGIEVRTKAISKEFVSLAPCRCVCPSSYVLFTNYVTLEPPIRCLDCFCPAPLYRLPTPSSGEHYKTIVWQSNYQACDRLQMNCRVLERSTTQQISSLRSSLSSEGRAICREYAALVGKPFYYYLYRAAGRSRPSEMRRLCPNCGGQWLLSQARHSLFDFRCDSCCLLSNIAWNVRSSRTGSANLRQPGVLRSNNKP